jgi:hypothetical protein
MGMMKKSEAMMFPRRLVMEFVGTFWLVFSAARGVNRRRTVVIRYSPGAAPPEVI